MFFNVITAAKCGSTSSALNSVVNTFMELKKLELSVEKCATVHIGNKQSKTMCLVKQFHSEDTIRNKGDIEGCPTWKSKKPNWYIIASSLLNGCIINSEVWCGYSNNGLKDLEVIDH